MWIVLIAAFALPGTPLQQMAVAQDVTGLSGWTLFLDPGHSRTENQGLYRYSEAEKVLRVGLTLREMLLSQTDIDTVYISRTNDNQSVSLSQRTDKANSLGADFFHSIHSNAGPASVNNTLMLHGGWRSDGQTVEKTPRGGKFMGDLMIRDLTAAMRIETIGNWADRNFYQGSSVRFHDRQYPYLHVNRESSMASLLSEAGFHTSPVQQVRNINADWKRLEAQSHFWSVLAYHEVARPAVGIVTGTVRDAETELPINGAQVSIAGASYVTDTYDSTFRPYSSDPEELRNGFYYLENLPNATGTLTVEAEGHYPATLEVDVRNDDFTFADVDLVSSVPPSVTAISLEEGEKLNVGRPLVFTFSRAMDRASVQEAISLDPAPDTLRFTWVDDATIRILTDGLAFVTPYTLTIAASATDASAYAHGFDGDGDGESGGAFTYAFETSPADVIGPRTSAIYPQGTLGDGLLPIGTVTFDEPLDTTGLDGEAMYYVNNGRRVPGEIRYYEVGERSVLNFFPAEPLLPDSYYIHSISGSLTDTLGNRVGSRRIVKSFNTGSLGIASTASVDDFDNDLGAWWQPSQSGSTTGYVAEQTLRSLDSVIVNPMTGSVSAVRMIYGWNELEAEHLIRLYRNRTTPKVSSSAILQVFLFGDGSGNPFRFMVRDGNGQLEGSEWIPVDWIGWKLVSWDMSSDPVVPWVNGNGTVDGSPHLDSFQFTWTPGAPTSGTLIFDDLRAVTLGTPTSTPADDAQGELPTRIELLQNHPNPFNPTTRIRFALPESGFAEIRVYDLLGRHVDTAFSGIRGRGFHTVEFDGSSLSSGVYVYRLTGPGGSATRTFTLLK